MRRALDTNVLIYAHLPAFEHHPAVRSYVLRQLADLDVTLVVTPLVLHEFVHVLTDPGRFEPPVPMAEGLAVARQYLRRENVECLAVDEASFQEACRLLERHRLGRRRIADTLLAATLMVNGIRELITCDPEDFRIFEQLVLLDPRDRV